MTTPADLTDALIEAVRAAAADRGDYALVLACNRALGLIMTPMTVTEARFAICDAIDYEAAQGRAETP